MLKVIRSTEPKVPGQPGLVANRIKNLTQMAQHSQNSSNTQNTFFHPKQTSSAAPIQFKTEKTLPLIQEIDLKKAFSWFKVDGADADPNDFNEIIDDMKTGFLDLLEKDKKGLNYLHTAAQKGCADFFDLIRTTPEIWERIKNHLNDYSGTRCSVLGYAIRSNNFDLAITLITKCNIDVNALVHDVMYNSNDNTSSMLRLAFTYLFTENFDDFSDSKKKSLEKLISILIGKGLQFFNTPNSHCPPAFQIEANLFTTFEQDDYDIMQNNKLTEAEYSLLYNLQLLKTRSNFVFKLCIAEAEKIKSTNSSAQNMLSLLGKHEILLSAMRIDRHQCLVLN